MLCVFYTLHSQPNRKLVRPSELRFVAQAKKPAQPMPLSSQVSHHAHADRRRQQEVSDVSGCAPTHFEAPQVLYAARCWTLHLSLNTKVAPVALVQASRGQNVVQQHLLRLRQVIHVVAM